MKPKKQRVKLKPNQLEKKIKEDSQNKWNFILPREGTIEFNQSLENIVNSKFSLILPVASVSADGTFQSDGESGLLLNFYIPKIIYTEVLSIINLFEIPESLHQEIMWGYLNMVFAASESSSESRIREVSHKNYKEWIEAFGIFENLANEKYKLNGLVLEYTEQNASSEYQEISQGKIKTKSITSNSVLKYLIEALQYFRTSDTYDISKSRFYHAVDAGIPQSGFDGYKNTTKAWQSYYSVVFFEYLGEKAVNNELIPILSKRKMCLLIGKLMILSGLLTIKTWQGENKPWDENIIGTIEKKINIEIKSKSSTNNYKNRLLNPGEKGIQTPPFYFHFREDI